ncbi:MAG: hypothetical protein AB1758_32745 [Candidatus Eremiobacterota bacterium]
MANGAIGAVGQKAQFGWNGGIGEGRTGAFPGGEAKPGPFPGGGELATIGQAIQPTPADRARELEKLKRHEEDVKNEDGASISLKGGLLGILSGILGH